MKILFITAELGYRGTPRALANYVRILSPDHDIAIWGYCEGGDTANCLAKEGYSVYCGEKDAKMAFSFEPDIVNIHRAGFYIARETEILSKFKQMGAKCIETNVFGRVDWSVEKLIDVSLQISKWDLYRWNAWKGKYRVPGVYVPYPVDTSRYFRASLQSINELRQHWLSEVGKSKKDMAFVLGRIGKTNWKFLERPLRVALEAHPDLIFVHVGDYGDKALPDSIRFHPRVCVQSKMLTSDALSLFYSACDAMVSMSGNGESFGYVNAEAMACETPVIALSTPFRDNAQLEMVANVGGVVIGSPDQLTMAIEKVRQGKFNGYACRQSIVDRYSFLSVRERLLHVISCCTNPNASKATEELGKRNFLTLHIDRKAIFRALKQTGSGTISLCFLRMFHSPLGCRMLNFIKRHRNLLRFGV